MKMVEILLLKEIRDESWKEMRVYCCKNMFLDALIYLWKEWYDMENCKLWMRAAQLPNIEAGFFHKFWQACNLNFLILEFKHMYYHNVQMALAVICIKIQTNPDWTANSFMV